MLDMFESTLRSMVYKKLLYLLLMRNWVKQKDINETEDVDYKYCIFKIHF